MQRNKREILLLHREKNFGILANDRQDCSGENEVKYNTYGEKSYINTHIIK